jgi:hypothetical protein
MEPRGPFWEGLYQLNPQVPPPGNDAVPRTPGCIRWTQGSPNDR